MYSPQAKIAGIILAAGCSTRMGRIKQVLPYRGIPLLQHVLDSATRASQLDQVVLLLGYCADEIRKSLDLKGVKHKWVPEYWHGQSVSLRLGVEEVERLGASAALFLLGDQPLIPPEVIDRVAAAYREHNDPIVLPTCGGKRGNPVLMDYRVFPFLKGISGDIGGRAIFPHFEGAIREVEISCPGIHIDVDEWQDYRRLLEEE